MELYRSSPSATPKGRCGSFGAPDSRNRRRKGHRGISAGGRTQGVRYEPFAPRTITTQAAFAAELGRVRISGYAYDDEEHIEGIRCIAAPVFANTGRVVGSLCVVGPRSRMTRQKLKELRSKVLAICRALSKKLGWRGA
jgi:DNA-binding IclR family transcriptional regulator